MRMVSREEMIRLDRESIQEHGISAQQLMEEAGGAVAKTVERLARKGDLTKKQVAIVCGLGNNGGDGFVAGRLLRQSGWRVDLFLLGRSQELKGESRWAYERFEKVKKKGKSRVVEIDRLEDLSPSLEGATLVIDAIFGTGYVRRDDQKRPSLSLKAIRLIHQMRRKGRIRRILAVDLPSGMDANTGEVGLDVVPADWTVTLGFAKIGCLAAPGCTYCGALEVAPLGLAPALLKLDHPPHLCIEPEDFKDHFQGRVLSSHKGDYGHVIVIGGSRRMPGALFLAASGALRAGAGKVTAVVPGREVAFALSAQIPEAMWLPVAENGEGFFAEEAAAQISTFLDGLGKGKGAIVIGCGMGQAKGARLILEMILRRWEDDEKRTPLVVDADALNLWAKYEPKPITGGLKSLTTPIVLTPHPAELGRLLNLSTEEIQKNRVGALRRAARVLNGWIVLKGYRSMLSPPSDPLHVENEIGILDVNPTGNPGMAKGGMGDLLAGILGARLARIAPGSDQQMWREAIQASLYIHGMAADRAVRTMGEEALLPRDVLDQLPQTFLSLQPTGKALP